MFSTLRWTISVLVLSLLLVQIVSACPGQTGEYVNGRAPNDGNHHKAKRAVTVRRDLHFPDTNSGKGINRGDRVQNRVCKKWYGIRDHILREVFHGECGDSARAAVRLAFHDAGTFSLKLKRQGRRNGGADGSMLVDPDEIDRPDNAGLQDIVAQLRPLASQFGVSNADILHVSGILGVIICPGGPPIETYVGRRDARNKNPTGLLPDVNDSVEKMVARFADMGISVRHLMALIGAHSTATQRFVDPSQAGFSQDSTPDIWDVKFYGETLNDTTPDGVFKFASDVAFAHHPVTRRDFERFVDDQDDWDEDYAVAHEQMSLLGVDRSRLTRCTEILPPKIDLGPLFVDRDEGMSSDEDGDPEDLAGAEPDDGYTLRVDRTRLRVVLRKLRKYWGYSG